MSWHLSPMQRFLPYMVLYLRLDSKKKTILFFYRPIYYGFRKVFIWLLTILKFEVKLDDINGIEKRIKEFEG
jgi:hypothetical protein